MGEQVGAYAGDAEGEPKGSPGEGDEGGDPDSDGDLAAGGLSVPPGTEGVEEPSQPGEVV